MTDLNAIPENQDIDQLHLAATQGEANAQFKLGTLYESGEGVAESAAEAAKWYRKAASLGHVEAKYHLARLYATGQGVQENDAEAMKWLRMSAEQGYAPAQFNLSYRHNIGKGVSKDATEAAKWSREAADRGHMDAQHCLGCMYHDGEGVQKDAAEAAKWFRRAAEQGRADSQFILGTMYYMGEGVRKDAAKSAKWTHKAAKQGHADAQFNLGIMYETGEGVPQRAAEAMKWYRKAARQGHLESQGLTGITDTDENGSMDETVTDEPTDPFEAPESEWITQETDMFLSDLVHRRQSVDSRLADENVGEWLLWEFLETPEAMILDVVTKWYLLRTAHVAESDIWKKLESHRDEEIRRHDTREVPLPTPIDLDAYIEYRLGVEDPAYLTLDSRFIKEQINFCRRYTEHQSEHGWQPPKEWLGEKISAHDFDSGNFGANFPTLPDEPTLSFAGSTTQYFPGSEHLQQKLRDLRFLMLPGDEFWAFNSPSEYWQKLCGRAGVALVRNGNPVGHVVLVMN